MIGEALHAFEQLSGYTFPELVAMESVFALVAETNGPGTDPGPPGIKGIFFKRFKKKAGSVPPWC